MPPPTEAADKLRTEAGAGDAGVSLNSVGADSSSSRRRRLSTAVRQYDAFNLHPMTLRPNFTAVYSALPMPANGVSTVSPGFDHSFTHRSMNLSCRGQGCGYRNRARCRWRTSTSASSGCGGRWGADVCRWNRSRRSPPATSRWRRESPQSSPGGPSTILAGVGGCERGRTVGGMTGPGDPCPRPTGEAVRRSAAHVPRLPALLRLSADPFRGARAGGAAGDRAREPVDDAEGVLTYLAGVGWPGADRWVRGERRAGYDAEKAPVCVPSRMRTCRPGPVPCAREGRKPSASP